MGCKNMCGIYPDIFRSPRLSEVENGKMKEFKEMAKELSQLGRTIQSWRYREDIAYCSTCEVRFRTDEAYLHKCKEVYDRNVPVEMRGAKEPMFWKNHCFCCGTTLRRKKTAMKKDSEVKRF